MATSKTDRASVTHARGDRPRIRSFSRHDVVEQLDMPAGVFVSGLEADGAGLFYCGEDSSGKVRSVRKPMS